MTNMRVSIQFHSLDQLHLGPLDSTALAVFLHSLVYLVHEEQGICRFQMMLVVFLMSSTNALEWYIRVKVMRTKSPMIT
jgi:hypothetical protein